MDHAHHAFHQCGQIQNLINRFSLDWKKGSINNPFGCAEYIHFVFAPKLGLMDLYLNEFDASWSSMRPMD